MILPLAAATTRITLGTLVVCTSFRPPALAAKMADTIDEMSSERLILGLDAGWHQLSIRHLAIHLIILPVTSRRRYRCYGPPIWEKISPVAQTGVKCQCNGKSIRIAR